MFEIDWWLVLQYLIIALFIISIILIYLYLVIPQSKEPSIRYSDIKSNLKTGDIILFGERGPFDLILVRFFTMCPSIHASIVYRDNEKLYLFEGTYRERKDLLSGKKKDGAVLLDLEERLKEQSKRAIYYVPINKPINNNLFIETVKKYQDVEWNGELLSWLKTNILKKPDKTNAMFCSQFVASILKECGVLEKEKEAYEYSPCHFQNNKLKTIGGFRYKKAIPILTNLEYQEENL